MADGAGPCYKTASLFMGNKTWVKLDTHECKVYFMREEIPRGMHDRLDGMTAVMERAMQERYS